MAAKTISSLAIRLSLNSDQVKRGVTQANAGLQRFGDRTSRFNEKLRRSSKELDGYAGRFRKLQSNIAGNIGRMVALGSAVAVARQTLGAMRTELDEIDAAGKFANRIGIAVGQLNALRVSAKFAGVETNTLQMSLQRMTRRVAEAAAGSGEAVKALQQLGLDAQELSRLSPDQQLAAIFDELVKLETQGEKAAIAMKLFDTEGVALLNDELAFTSAGLEKATAKVKEFNLELSDVDAARAAEINDKLTEMDLRWQGVIRQMMRLADALRLFEALQGVLGTISSTVEIIKQELAGIFDVVQAPAILGAVPRGERQRGRDLDREVAKLQERLAAQRQQPQDRKAEDQRDKAYREHQEQTRLARQQLEIERRRLAQPPIQVQTYRLPG